MDRATPTWRSTVEEVVSYALVEDGVLALVDPMLPAHDDPRRALLLGQLDEMTASAERVELLISSPTTRELQEPVRALLEPCRRASGATPV